MKFRTGFVMGVAAGAWAVNKASELRRSRRPLASTGSQGAAADEAAEKLRAFTGLAKERLSDLAEGPLGNIARERLADLIGSSLGGNASKSAGRLRNSGGGDDDGTIDTTARWPR
ncbi:MAG: hypothetical protein ACYCSF_12125 [Acidimicrobiales bacterium]